MLINYHATTQILFNNNAMKILRILHYKEINFFDHSNNYYWLLIDCFNGKKLLGKYFL